VRAVVHALIRCGDQWLVTVLTVLRDVNAMPVFAHLRIVLPVEMGE